MNALALILVGVIILFVGYGVISFYLIVRPPRNNPKTYLERTSSTSAAQNQKLVVIGDSLTHGTLSENYVDILSQRIKRDELFIDIINAGMNGNHSSDVLDRVADIIMCHPEFIVILIGTNDAVAFIDQNTASVFSRCKNRHPSTLTFFTSNLNSLVTRLQSIKDVKIALLSLPPIGENLNHPVAKACISFSKAIRDLAEQLSVEYLPLHELMIEYLNHYPAQPKYDYDKRNRVFMISLFKRILGYNSQKISEALGFRLHIDFFHLNHTGATMIADMIETFYKNYC